MSASTACNYAGDAPMCGRTPMNVIVLLTHPTSANWPIPDGID